VSCLDSVTPCRVPVRHSSGTFSRPVAKRPPHFVLTSPEVNAPADYVRFLVKCALVGRLDLLDLGLHPGRGRELPRGHRQRGGHWQHFFYIHFAFPTLYQANSFEGHIRVASLQTLSRPDVGGASTIRMLPRPPAVRMPSYSYDGPAYILDYLWHDYTDIGIERRPITVLPGSRPTSFLLQWVRHRCGRPPILSLRPMPVPFWRPISPSLRRSRRLLAGRVDLAAQDPDPTTAAAVRQDGALYQVRRWVRAASTKPGRGPRTRADCGWAAGVVCFEIGQKSAARAVGRCGRVLEVGCHLAGAAVRRMIG